MMPQESNYDFAGQSVVIRAAKVACRTILDFLYPPRCPICDAFIKDDVDVCSDCELSFVRIGVALNFPHIRNLQFDACYAPFIYEGRIKDAIHGFKYAARLDRERFFSDEIRANIADLSFDVVVPVPMHGSKLRRRGFNQSALLARRIAKDMRKKFDRSSLIKLSDVHPQVGLERNDRIKNVKGSFAIAEKSVGIFRDKAVLIVDDVITTGATVNECARIIKRDGAKLVYATAIARTL